MELLRKTVSGIMLTLSLVGILTFAFDAQLVKAEASWVWVRNTVTGAYGEAVVGTGAALYIARGTSFYRYLPADNSFVELASPPKPDGYAFKTGTTLAWDFNDSIYALFGAATGESRRWFYRYSISSNAWEALANTTADQGEGDALTWVGKSYNFIYATVGGEQRPTFLLFYDPSTNSWGPQFPAPLPGMGDGASMVWTGSDCLYILRGEYLEEEPLYDFWSYNITSHALTSLADIPAYPHDDGVGGVGDGGSLLYVGFWLPNQTDYIYALSGNQAYPESIPDNRTYRYRISTNTWERLADLPFGVGYYVGCRLGYADGHVYAWQGTPSTWAGGGDDLAKYKPSIIDLTPPTTTHDYDGLWHTSDYTITLTATDDISGVAETYYKINGGPTKSVIVDGQPRITVESANNTLEYWSVDNAGNEELPHNMLTGIKLDKTPPTSSINLSGTSGNEGWFVSDVTVSTSANDTLSGVDKIEYNFNNVTWTEYVAPFNITDEGLTSIYYRSIDKAGNAETARTATIKIDKTAPMIGIPSRMPEGNVEPDQKVKVLVNVTDSLSGIKDVTLSYNLNDSALWINSPMTFNSTTGLYEATIPGQQANTFVKYEITAYDNAGNHKVEDNGGQYYIYTVIPEFPSLVFLLMLTILTSLAVALVNKFKLRKNIFVYEEPHV